MSAGQQGLVEVDVRGSATDVGNSFYQLLAPAVASWLLRSDSEKARAPQLASKRLAASVRRNAETGKREKDMRDSKVQDAGMIAARHPAHTHLRKKLTTRITITLRVSGSFLTSLIRSESRPFLRIAASEITPGEPGASNERTIFPSPLG